MGAGAARRASGGRERLAAARGRLGGHVRSWRRGWDRRGRCLSRVVRPDVRIWSKRLDFGSETAEMVPCASIRPCLVLQSVRIAKSHPGTSSSARSSLIYTLFMFTSRTPNLGAGTCELHNLEISALGGDMAGGGVWRRCTVFWGVGWRGSFTYLYMVRG